MEVFNINNFKKGATDIDLDELDDRYVNTEGDTIDHLNAKAIQLQYMKIRLYHLQTIRYKQLLLMMKLKMIFIKMLLI